MVMGICLRYAQREDLAQDIFQDVFVKVFTQLDRLENEAALPGWIKSITIREAINAYQHQIRRSHETLDEIPESHQRIDLDLSILEGLDQEKLLALIQSLGNSHRMVFNLFCIEGYNHKEIGERLQISESSSRVYLSQAKKTLQEKILFLENPKKIAYG